MYGDTLRYSVDWYRLKQDSSLKSGKSNPPRSRSTEGEIAVAVPTVEPTTYCHKKKKKKVGIYGRC